MSGLDDAEAATLERAIADQTPRDFAQVVDTSPADVSAATALTGIEVPEVANGTSAGAAGKTFDSNGLHNLRFGAYDERGDPSNEGHRLGSPGPGQSVEYLG